MSLRLMWKLEMRPKRKVFGGVNRARRSLLLVAMQLSQMVRASSRQVALHQTSRLKHAGKASWQWHSKQTVVTNGFDISHSFILHLISSSHLTYERFVLL